MFANDFLPALLAHHDRALVYPATDARGVLAGGGGRVGGRTRTRAGVRAHGPALCAALGDRRPVSLDGRRGSFTILRSPLLLRQAREEALSFFNELIGLSKYLQPSGRDSFFHAILSAASTPAAGGDSSTAPPPASSFSGGGRGRGSGGRGGVGGGRGSGQQQTGAATAAAAAAFFDIFLIILDAPPPGPSVKEKMLWLV